jgi:hypothetical protein
LKSLKSSSDEEWCDGVTKRIWSRWSLRHKAYLNSLKSSSDEVLESQSVFESTWSETTDFAQVDVPFSSRLCI